MNKRPFPGLSFCLFLCLAPSFLFAQVSSDFTRDYLSVSIPPDKRTAVDAGALSPKVLSVYVGDSIPASRSGLPSVLGNLSLNGDTLLFRPVFPFRPGQPYVAVFLDKEVFRFECAERQDLLRPKLLAIYPTAEVIPANQLKFYLRFSQPMRAGSAYAYVQVKDQAGRFIAEPFVRLQPELWNDTYTRLTLWLDPGRVKRALGPHRAYGEIFSPGQEITVTVDPAWEDRQGQPLGSVLSQTYRIGDHDRTSPVPDHWKLRIPKAHTRGPVVVEFGEPLDRALLLRSLSILDEYRREVAGEKVLLAGEQGWSFSPRSPWLPGRYQIRILGILEDLAGNNLNRLFDRNLSKETTSAGEQEYFYLEFEVEE